MELYFFTFYFYLFTFTFLLLPFYFLLEQLDCTNDKTK